MPIFIIQANMGILAPKDAFFVLYMPFLGICSARTVLTSEARNWASVAPCLRKSPRTVPSTLRSADHAQAAATSTSPEPTEACGQLHRSQAR